MSRLNTPDTDSDIQLRTYLDQTPPITFNMVAGAGSGKTTSLVKALYHVITTKGSYFKRRGQQIACITYTEVAAKEIWNDVENNPIIHVSTIHSFFWTIIQSFQNDIKKWVLYRIDEKLLALREKAASFGPRVQQRTKDKNSSDIVRLEKHKELIVSVQYFKYGIGSDYSKGILGHDDIIKLVTNLINEKPLLNKIISQKYPYVFVDESQDTFPEIVEALRAVAKENASTFCLGFFGDPMQKIYSTGVGEIVIEEEWKTITKVENFRCSQNVLSVINNIRRTGDGLKQTRGWQQEIDGAPTPVEGSATMFIFPADDKRDDNISRVQQWISNKQNDAEWLKKESIKFLVIVHRMAAIRLGFADLYAAMNDDAPTAFKEGFLDGTAWPLRPFISTILPLVTYWNDKKDFEVLNVLRQQSPLLLKETVKDLNLAEIFTKLKTAVSKLSEMMKVDSAAKVSDVISLAKENHLVIFDERIIAHLNGIARLPIEGDDEDDSISKENNAMINYLACPAHQFFGYKKYYERESPFATQQGIKGAQYDRVLTILDDEEGTHIQFSYNKYFGITNLSERDLENIRANNDNTIDRTRRLFYVCCSRAKKDLAVVLFVSDVNLAEEKIRESGIFSESSILTLNDIDLG